MRDKIKKIYTILTCKLHKNYQKNKKMNTTNQSNNLNKRKTGIPPVYIKINILLNFKIQFTSIST